MSYLMCFPSDPSYCLRCWLCSTVLRDLQVGLLVSVSSCFSTACGLIAELVKQGHHKNSSVFFCMCATTKSSCSEGLNELWDHKKKYFISQGYQLFFMKQKHLTEEFYFYLIITAQIGMGQAIIWRDIFMQQACCRGSEEP